MGLYDCPSGKECVEWFDPYLGDRSRCQDCSDAAGDQMIWDNYEQDTSRYYCPGEYMPAQTPWLTPAEPIRYTNYITMGEWFKNVICWFKLMFGSVDECVYYEETYYYA